VPIFVVGDCSAEFTPGGFSRDLFSPANLGGGGRAWKLLYDDEKERRRGGYCSALPRRRIAELALKNLVPAISPTNAFAAEGGLAAYAASQTEMVRKTAAYVDKILKAASRPTCRSSSDEIFVGDQPQDRQVARH